jgi:hypothetical protein
MVCVCVCVCHTKKAEICDSHVWITAHLFGGVGIGTAYCDADCAGTYRIGKGHALEPVCRNSSVTGPDI